MKDTEADAAARVIALLQAGQFDAATDACRNWLADEPDNAQAHYLLGMMAGRAGNIASAVTHFELATAREPANGAFHAALGLARLQLGALEPAMQSLRKAVDLNPRELVALNELGNLCWRQEHVGEAATWYERVLAVEPDNIAALLNLGNARSRLGQLRDAARIYERALAVRPDSADARFGLANALSSMGHQERAATIFAELERTHPDLPGLQVNFGLALARLGRGGEALAHYDRAIAANPEDYRAYNNRGNVLRSQQRVAEAEASFRRALAIRGDYASAHSNLLMTLNYTETSQAALYRESLRFDTEQAARCGPPATAFRNGPTPERPLRLGYVSADFRRHSVAYFLRHVLATHDRGQVHVTCYANVENPDQVTAQFQAIAERWQPIVGIPDDEVARQVRADGIDVLVDLGGHTGGNRLLVFARKPAPVQVTWLGYPNTTGMSAIDYRLTDDIADPAGEADELHSERLVRLPGGFLCYRPGELPATGDAPRSSGDAEVTFASFNTLDKVTAEVMRVWASILRRVPRSRLLLKADALADAATCAGVLERFAAHGVAPERIELLAWVPDYAQHMALYGRVDIGLDPFPFNGATTTCEALWMGVPVVTLRGNRHAARVGASILHHAGLPEWITGSEADYVELAVARAGERAALAAGRSALRERIRSSALTDSARFTRELEQAYRRMWTEWCATQT